MGSTLVVGVTDVLLVGDILREGRGGDEVRGREVLLLGDVNTKNTIVQGALQ